MRILKLTLGLVFCNLFRLFRLFPNNDPIMGVMFPFARQEKCFYAVFFAMTSMISFDLLTGKIGIWTLVTSFTYGFLALFFYRLFRLLKSKGKQINRITYLFSGIVGVLFFDFITGPVMSSQLFNIPFMSAFLGQIPFTLYHLGSVSFFTLFLTPLLDGYIINSPSLEDMKIIYKIRQITHL